ncbi:MAG TPA: penicillin-binding transpeptidase domain-containing protein, partial [Ktedonobacteraceae bacterium]
MNIGSNIRKLTLMFITFFIAISGGLVYWQVVVAQQVTSNIHNSRTCMAGNAPIRGNIYDRNGVLLAYSVPSNTGCGYLRHYTDPSLAGLIGYYVSPQYPSTGVEHQFDNVLSGQVGSTAMQNLVNQTLHRPPVGGNIYLTVDERIQQLVNQHFDDPIPIDHQNTFPTDRGSVIVSDPHTGEILAMLSRPTFDPNKLVSTLASNNLSYFDQLQADPEQPLLERPINGLFIPGSVYKTATLEAGLDSGKTTLSQEFDKQQAEGPVNVNGEIIGPTGNNIDTYTFHFPVTTEYGYTHSDNLIYAQIAAETGAQTWLDYQHRFYVGQAIPFDLPVTPSQVTQPGQSTLNGIDL